MTHSLYITGSMDLHCYYHMFSALQGSRAWQVCCAGCPQQSLMHGLLVIQDVVEVQEYLGTLARLKNAKHSPCMAPQPLIGSCLLMIWQGLAPNAE